MVIYGETLEIKNVTEGYTKEQVEQNIEQFTEDRNEALYELYEIKRETAAFNESGNKYGYEMLLDDLIAVLKNFRIARYYVKSSVEMWNARQIYFDNSDYFFVIFLYYFNCAFNFV